MSALFLYLPFSRHFYNYVLLKLDVKLTGLLNSPPNLPPPLRTPSPRIRYCHCTENAPYFTVQPNTPPCTYMVATPPALRHTHFFSLSLFGWSVE